MCILFLPLGTVWGVCWNVIHNSCWLWQLCISAPTLHLIQRQHEVLLCRNILQHHSQFSFVLHCRVYTVLHLHGHHSHSLDIGLGECTHMCVCLYSGPPTFGCSAYHSSICESNSQVSKVSSTSPRKLLCPKRSWCHTETCRVRVSSCEWLITYYTAQRKVTLAIK